MRVASAWPSTSTGIFFSIVLVAVQLGLSWASYLATLGVIDCSCVDLWVVPEGSASPWGRRPLHERKISEPRHSWCRQRVEEIIRAGDQRPDGAEEGVILRRLRPVGARYGRPRTS